MSNPNFCIDTLIDTGVDLVSHTAIPTGGSWSKNAGYIASNGTSNSLCEAAGLRANDANGFLDTYSITPGSNVNGGGVNIKLQITVSANSATVCFPAVAAFCSASAFTCYLAGISTGTGNVNKYFIVKRVAGTQFGFSPVYSSAISVGVHNLYLQVTTPVFGTVVLTLFDNGIQVLQVTDNGTNLTGTSTGTAFGPVTGTGAALTQTNIVGVSGYGNATDAHITNFSAVAVANPINIAANPSKFANLNINPTNGMVTNSGAELKTLFGGTTFNLQMLIGQLGATYDGIQFNNIIRYAVDDNAYTDITAPPNTLIDLCPGIYANTAHSLHVIVSSLDSTDRNTPTSFVQFLNLATDTGQTATAPTTGSLAPRGSTTLVIGDSIGDNAFGDPGGAHYSSPIAVSGIVQTSGVATATTNSAHNLQPGSQVTLLGANQTGYDGVFTVTSVPTSTTFTYLVPAATATPATFNAALFAFTAVGPAADSMLSYAQPVGQSFNQPTGSDTIQWCHPGWGYTVTGSGVPAFNGSAASLVYSSGKSRLTAGVYAAMPNQIVICLGTNDFGASDAAVTANALAAFQGQRAAAPTAPIFVVTPPNGAKKSAISAAVTAWGDANGHLLSTPAYFATGLGGAQSSESYDGTHLRTMMQSAFAAWITQQIAMISSSGSGASTVSASTGRMILNGTSKSLSSGKFKARASSVALSTGNYSKGN